MLSFEEASARVAGADVDQPVEDDEIGETLADLGVAFVVPGYDVDDLEESYRSVLQDAGRVAGVRIHDIRLDGGELHWRRDGEPVSWHVEHLSDAYLDHLACFEFVHLLEPDDERTFHSMPQQESGDDSVYVLASAEQARRLSEELGLVFD